MPKFHLNSFFSFLSLSFRGNSTTTVSPNIIWKIIIVMMIFAIILSAVASVFLYKWVSIPSTATMVAKSEKDVLSVGEIRTVVNFYKTKQKNFQELFLKRPVAPSFEMGSGIDVNTLETPALSETLNIETAPPASSSLVQ